MRPKQGFGSSVWAWIRKGIKPSGHLHSELSREHSTLRHAYHGTIWIPLIGARSYTVDAVLGIADTVKPDTFGIVNTT